MARVVPLARLLDAASDEGKRPLVAVTFDDAYRGSLTAGFDELAERGLPATVFAAPSLLGDRSLWWDQLARPGDGVLTAADRRHALEDCAGETGSVIRWAESQARRPVSLPAYARTATEEELLAAASREGMTVGSHSWSHRNLARLETAETADELVRSKRWLEDRFSSFIPWLAYPYGLSTATVEHEAKTAGYVGAVRIDGAWMQRATDTHYRLPRLNVPAGLTTDGFRLRMAGIRCR